MKQTNRFIVVDDDDVSNLISERLLRKFSPDADIKLYTQPEIALEAIHDGYTKENGNTSTVLFLDINMPSMTGWDFLDLFKKFSDEIRNHFTIYILSSSVDQRDKEKAESNSFVSGFLSKPLRLESIKQILV